MRDVDLALTGNGRLGLSIDACGTLVRGCYARFDGDSMFCGLLDTLSWRIRLNGVSIARRKRVKPRRVTTSRNLASPVCAPRHSPTS